MCVSCSTTVKTHDGKLYCRACHTKSFGLKGYGYGQGAGVLATNSQQGTGMYDYIW